MKAMTQTTLVVLFLLLPAGCMQQMAKQPSYRPLQPSDFFDDGRASRPLVAGTVPHGFDGDTRLLFLRKDRTFYEGLQTVTAADAAKLAAAIGTPTNPASLGTLVTWLPYTDTFPMAIDRKVLERGKLRYNIYCAVCHDQAGTGDGMIPRRGFTKPPNFHTDESPAVSGTRGSSSCCATCPWATTSTSSRMVSGPCRSMPCRCRRKTAGPSSPTFALCN